MPKNCLKCFFVVFENVKNLTGEKKKSSEIRKIRVGILLYTKNFPEFSKI